MNHTETVCFSLYRGEALIPVTVFKEKTWVLFQGVELQVSIIGKSHRIISRAGDQCLTEFIAYPWEEERFQPLDHFYLNTGEIYQKTYREGDWLYRVRIEVLPRLFNSMRDFLVSLQPAGRVWETLDHGFALIENRLSAGPFTGIAVDPESHVFHTVHTYPECGHSIISRTEICCFIPTT